MIRPTVLVIVTLAAASWNNDAAASDVRIAGRVPGVCVTNYTPPVDGEMKLGRVSAYCNIATGYTLSIRHAGFTSTKNFSWEGRLIPVQPGGHSVLINSSGPGLHRADLSLAGADEDETRRAAQAITIEIVES